MKCPLPVLKAGKVLRGLSSGTALRVLVTDLGAPKDFKHFCRTTGAELISLEPLDDHTAITIRRV